MDLNKISKITSSIYLSGVIPLAEEKFPEDIKFILSCIDNPYAMAVHKKIMMTNPDIIVLYLPYDDVLTQNLWQTKNVSILSNHQNNNMSLLKTYKDRPMIEIGYHFMNTVLSSGHNILVHCMAGISRSVSMITYYLMKKYGINYNKAYHIIHQKRSIAYPNDSFHKQLAWYDRFREKFTERHAENIIKNI